MVLGLGQNIKGLKFMQRSKLTTQEIIKHLGFAIPKGMVVHHIDGDPTNDDIDNLALVTAAAHNTIHHLRRN